MHNTVSLFIEELIELNTSSINIQQAVRHSYDQDIADISSAPSAAGFNRSLAFFAVHLETDSPFEVVPVLLFMSIPEFV